MALRNSRPKMRERTAVELALMAIEPNANPFDADMSGVGSDPTDLDLGDGTEATVCSHPRYVCAECGAPLCVDAS